MLHVKFLLLSLRKNTALIANVSFKVSVDSL